MKKRLLILMTVTGMIILLGGLLTYGLGVHEIIPVPRPDLIVVGTFRRIWRLTAGMPRHF